MAIADDRQRFMPLPDDRLPGRGQVLAYPEAVRLVNPVEPEFKGEVCHSIYSLNLEFLTLEFVDFIALMNKFVFFLVT
jgi:hypothetical protein